MTSEIDPVDLACHSDLLAGHSPSTARARPVLNASADLGAWLGTVGGSLAFTTYQSSRLFLLSADADGRTQSLERITGAAMGLAADPRGLWVANRHQIWRFANIGPRRVGAADHDAVYVPRRGHFLGPCFIHDIVADVRFRGRRYELLFANTHYSCIAAIDDEYSFVPVWRPSFVSAMVPEDRCHLNGICARDGELAYATLCGRSDADLGWKPMKSDGGCVWDIASDEVVCQGLSMPHSPRWYRGRLWLLNSGAGDFGYVDLANRKFVPVGQCPGFARGLCFVGDYAVIGLSKLRENAFSSGLSLVPRLQSQRIRQMCGLLVIDIRTGTLVHWLTIEGVVEELYDVVFLPGVMSPFTPGFTDSRSDPDLVALPAGETATLPGEDTGRFAAKHHLGIERTTEGQS